MNLPSAGFPLRWRGRTLPTIRSALALLLFSGLAGCDDSVSGTFVTEGEVPSADGVVIRYDVRGTGDPTIVLVPGWTNPRAIWGEHPTTLSRTNRVVAIDLAGHGVSGEDRADWTMDAFGGDVVAVVDQLELERVVLVGFSMGAGVVLEAAERLGDRVLGVVFVDQLKDPDMLPDPAVIEQMIPAMREAWGDTAFLRAFAFTPDAPDSLINHVREMTLGEPREYWFDMIRRYDEWMASEWVSTLERIDVPVAAINTPMPPTNVEALQRYAPSFTVDTIAGVGHAGILLQRVDDFDALLLAIVDRFTASQTAVQTD